MKFTVVIPTLNRAYALLWSVNSVLNQKGNHEVKVIISDNCSDDDTREVVLTIGDTRIQYISPEKRLSMSKHWEFAASHLEVDDGCVMYLGDDDVLDSSAFDIAAHIFSNFDVQAIKQGGAYYYTPDCDSSFAGYLLAFGIDGKIEVRESTKFLKDVADFQTGKSYCDLPALYHGFVKSNIISQLKERGSLFNKAAPDVYSAINIASLGISYAYLRYSFVLGVSSRSSNGVNVKNKTEIGQQFLKSSMEDFVHKYTFSELALLDFHVLDCLEDIHPYLDKDIQINYQKLYKNFLKHKSFENIKTAFEDLKKISSKKSIEIYLDLVNFSLVKKSFRFAIEKLVGKNISLLTYYHLRYFLQLILSQRSKKFSYFGNLQGKNICDPLSCKAFLEKNTEYFLLGIFSSKGLKSND